MSAAPTSPPPADGSHTGRSDADTLTELLRLGAQLCAIRATEALHAAMADGLIALCGAERGFFFLCGAAPKTLLAVCARGPAGGLLVGSPERRVLAACERALQAPREVHLSTNAQGRTTLCAVVRIEGEPQGILYVDGALDEQGAQARFIELYLQMASVALDNARYFERASNDLLTGLPNHSFLMDAIVRALRHGDPALGARGLLLLDLDRFRRVNASAGSEVGDRALVDVAQTLRDALSADGLVARVSADSFAVFLAADAHTRVHLRLHDVAERARAAVGAKIYAGVQLSCSVGAAPLVLPPGGGLSAAAQAAVSTCEQLLRQAQARGPGSIEVLSPPAD